MQEINNRKNIEVTKEMVDPRDEGLAFYHSDHDCRFAAEGVYHAMETVKRRAPREAKAGCLCGKQRVAPAE